MPTTMPRPTTTPSPLPDIPTHWRYDPENVWKHGYAIARGVFSAGETAEIHAATDRVKLVGLAKGTHFRQGNLVFWVDQDDAVGTNVRGMQWGAHLEAALERVRTDPRMLAIVAPLIGASLRQMINQLHWKTPGSRSAVSFHTDRRNRRPAAAFRDLSTSYVQTAIAVDPMTARNGALMVVPGSHRTPFLEDPVQGDNFAVEESYANLEAMRFRQEDLVALHADPGDVVLWHVDTIHGSGINRDPLMDRCIYINGYVRAQSCMRGHWAFIEGRPVPLPPIDVPVLVHHEAIWEDLAPRREAEGAKPTD